jgi:autotransporter-associated beta strand protein
LDNAITRGAYVTFSIAASDGYSLSLSDVAAYNVRRSNTGPSLGQWQYQIGSGSFANIGSAITWGSTTTSSGNAQTSISLSGISQLQSLAAGSTVTFRIVNYNTGTAGSNGGTWYLNDPSKTATNDFVINGSVTGTGGGNNLFWDGGNGWVSTISATGGNGTWSDGSGNWDSTKTANFGGAAGTVTLEAPSAAAGLVFTTSGYTLSGGTLALTGPSIDANLLSVAAGGTATITSPITGFAGLTKGGAGRLELGAANTFSGGVRIQSGTLSIASDGSLGDASNGLEFSGGTLAVPGSIDLGSRTISGASGSAGIAAIAVPGGSTLTSSGAVTLAALTLPSSGTLSFTGPASLASVSGAAHVAPTVEARPR